MNMNTESTPNEIEIVWLRRISQSQPTAWEGRTRNQETVHVFYKFGQLEVWMRQDLKGMPRHPQMGDDPQLPSRVAGDGTGN
jgi:hypothetical protein